MNPAEVQAMIEKALEPLQAELQELRSKLEMNSPAEETVSSPAVEAPSPTEPVHPDVPPERSDFQRFLQRGLEQEQVEYSEEKLEAKPLPKKGWNPFKR